jgi:drug/metabolite transporter (DMT)-like permease
LALVNRLRLRWHESTMLTLALLVTGVAAESAARHPVLMAQVALAGALGVTAAVTQPSFDALTQRLVAPGAQGRTFARFAVRQQLTWVLGALLPVAVSWRFGAGDQFLAVVLLVGAVGYAIGRRRPL